MEYEQEKWKMSKRNLRFYSRHETGTYDLPAAIEYVLGHTDQEDLYYIGHSMGLTMFFVLTSSLPQYNVKFRLMTGLAPAGYMAFSPSPIAKFFSFNPQTKGVLIYSSSK
jgi:predicted alpha/beta hydrolase